MPDSDPFLTVVQMAGGYSLSRCLHVVADLGVADALDETPRTAADLARRWVPVPTPSAAFSDSSPRMGCSRPTATGSATRLAFPHAFQRVASAGFPVR